MKVELAIHTTRYRTIPFERIVFPRGYLIDRVISEYMDSAVRAHETPLAVTMHPFTKFLLETWFVLDYIPLTGPVSDGPAHGFKITSMEVAGFHIHIHVDPTLRRDTLKLTTEVP
jgi:hypothetical protein